MTATLDPFAVENRADPAPVYRALRGAGRVHEVRPGINIVTHYADCDAIFGDPAYGHGYFSGINPFRPGVDPHTLPGSFLLMDPPDHTRLRNLVSKAFTPRLVAGLATPIHLVRYAVEGLTLTPDAAGEALGFMVGGSSDAPTTSV